MIKCQGTLRIKKIRQSRNGAFCIADLATDFGEFKVKDPMLDQFEEGEYQGTVWISEIYVSQYISYGKAGTELRARLHDLQVDSEDRKPVRSNEHSEPDPIEDIFHHIDTLGIEDRILFTDDLRTHLVKLTVSSFLWTIVAEVWLDVVEIDWLWFFSHILEVGTHHSRSSLRFQDDLATTLIRKVKKLFVYHVRTLTT